MHAVTSPHIMLMLQKFCLTVSMYHVHTHYSIADLFIYFLLLITVPTIYTSYRGALISRIQAQVTLKAKINVCVVPHAIDEALVKLLHSPL